jgi:S-adenosylmethionine decarboxylase
MAAGPGRRSNFAVASAGESSLLSTSFKPERLTAMLSSPDIWKTERGLTKSPPPGRFEGYEKRLEIEFFSNEFAGNVGLRTLNRSQLDEIVEAAKCRIISHISNRHMDIYLLSESSLIIYPHKFIIKTCGKTQLLSAIPLLISFAESIVSIKPKNLRYTRGCFMFPQDQLFPHRSFHEEICYLNKYVDRFLPSSIPEAYVMQGSSDSHNDCWHIYNASASDDDNCHHYSCPDPSYTIEICMTQLDSEKASVFHKKNYSSSSEMTSKSGLGHVISGFEIDAYNFEPCGYSMNGMKGPSFSTAHVTPEAGFSYASFEIVGYDPRELDEIESLVSRVLHCFGPLVVSVAVYVDRKIGARATDIVLEGYACQNTSHEDLLGDSLATYQTYTKPN